MVVMKFGGTSVQDRAAIERLIEIVRARRQTERRQASSSPHGPVVVVSALAGATDRLLAIAAQAGIGDADGALQSLRDLHERHVTVSEVVVDPQLRSQLLEEFDRHFSELSRLVSALAVLCELSPRWTDAVAAAGEIVSSRLVAAALHAHGLPASWVDPRQVVVTDAEHQKAAPQFPETTVAARRLLNPLLEAGQIPVIGGFVGATREGVTTTLGRGGSDYSAAIVGACLEVDEIQIWTDVDGMLTCDPRIVEDAKVVPHLSFAEASELAYFGAKVLHPATIQPAVARGIPVRILNARRRHGSGTLITAERPPSPHPLTAVASKGGVTVVDITSTRMLMAHGFLSRLFQVFERHKTAVDVVTTSEVSVSVTVDDPRRLPAIVAELKEFAEVSSEEQMAIVCVVGDSLPQDPTLVARVLAAVGEVPLRLISQAASRRNLTFVVREVDLRGVLVRLHEAFFASRPAPSAWAEARG